MAKKAKASRSKKAAPARKPVAKKAAARKAAAKKPAKAAARKKVSPVPPGYHTVTASLVQSDCAAALAFYKAAFGARVKMSMPGPGGKVIHAEIQVGDSMIMMADEGVMPPTPGQPEYKSPKTAGLSTGGLFLYVKNVDKAFERAVKAGCTVKMPPADMFWGDRFGSVVDPFGHTWDMGTHQEDVTPKEIGRRQQAFFAQMSQGQG